MSLGFPTRSDTNWTVQLQKMARDLKFRIQEEEGLFFLFLHMQKTAFLFMWLIKCNVIVGLPQAKRGEIWWFLVEQHRLKYPGLAEKTPHVDYSELLKQLTTHQHAILIDLGMYSSTSL